MSYNPDMPYADPNRQREYARKWKARRRDEWFADKYCAVCGTTSNLELDHIDSASKVSHKIWTWTQSRRDEELAKCQVLCKKHHQEKSAAGRQHTRHGTDLMWRKHGCRCDLCKEYVRQSKRASRARIAARIALGREYRSDAR
jgi:hypothetical protein